MGQTLSHGVYLPAEGERNCYSGLASNWNLLDAALGDIEGKASATHTHGNITNDGKVGTTANLPLITGTGGAVQAGSFGNAANTFCEGNDSRLSDARTPVAHTHTKADVTDLLNSNFIPSANNSYDLGSSSYQWNNLYAKNYYYNGVAWGLDKANIWSENNQFSKAVGLSSITGLADCAMAFTGLSNSIFFNTRGSSNFKGYGTFLHFGYNSAASPDRYGQIYLLRSTDKYGDTNDGFIPDASFKLLRIANYYKIIDFMESVRVQNDGSVNQMIPIIDNATDLGTSTSKWKTLNGINPGALSLPDFSADYDVSGDIVPPTGENQISINWGRNTFTPSVNGWLSVRIHKATSIEIYRSVRSSYCAASRVESADDICVCSPVVAGVEYTIKILATQFSPGYDHFRLSPCQGNV